MTTKTHAPRSIRTIRSCEADAGGVPTGTPTESQDTKTPHLDPLQFVSMTYGRLLQADTPVVADEDGLTLTGWKRRSVKKPARIAWEAWRLEALYGYRQTRIAEMLSQEHHRAIRQYTVSRMIRRVEKYRDALGLTRKVKGDTDAPKPKTITMDPALIDMGPRHDGKPTGWRR